MSWQPLIILESCCFITEGRLFSLSALYSGSSSLPGEKGVVKSPVGSLAPHTAMKNAMEIPVKGLEAGFSKATWGQAQASLFLCCVIYVCSCALLSVL